MLRQLPGFLMVVGGIVFASGLAAALGIPSDARPAALGIVAGPLAFVIGLLLDRSRERVPWLVTPSMRLQRRFVSGQALRSRMKVIRNAGTAFDEAGAVEVHAWEVGFWADLQATAPRRVEVYRKRETQMPPDGAGDWSRAVVDVLERRLILLGNLILEVPYEAGDGS